MQSAFSWLACFAPVPRRWSGLAARAAWVLLHSAWCSPAAAQAATGAPTVVLPPHLPAACFEQSAVDYEVPALVLVAIVKHESRGRNGVVGVNRNGSRDLGVAQHNTDSWVPYLQRRYGIEPESLRTNPCQSIRAAAYVLRREQNTPACRKRDIWCGVGRYHHPSSEALQSAYVPKVRAALDEMLAKGRF